MALQSDELHTSLQILIKNTQQPERFLSVQDELAAEFTCLTKTLYDFQKLHEPDGVQGSPLEQLVVENFDEEQIWQELELQNNSVLTHFESAVNQASAEHTLRIYQEEEECADEAESENIEDKAEDDDEEEDDSDGEDNAEKENRLKIDAAAEEEEEEEEEFSEEDSDIDFDVDKLEKQAKKQKKSDVRPAGSRRSASEVDDQFFKLSEMEAFLDEMDEREGKKGVGEEIDYFQDMPSDDDGDAEWLFGKSSAMKKQKKSKSSRNMKYKDYFKDGENVEQKEEEEEDEEDESAPDDEGEEDDEPAFEEEDDEEEEDFDMEEADAETRKARDALRRVTFDLPSDSEGEDVEDILGGKAKNKPEAKSAFEKRQEKMSEKIEELEKAALAEKPWQLSGEVSAQTRPENSMLEEDVEFDQASRMAPAVTEEMTLTLEDIIKQRIKDQVWDDVVRKEKPKEEAFEYKKRLTLDHEKSKLSLAEVYEQEYVKQTQEKKEEEENPAHVEIQNLMDKLFLKLDALSNFHFTPKPHVPEVKVVSNLPSITVEEVAPVNISSSTLLAPEEIKEKNKAGNVLGDSEKTQTDKKRERRQKKKTKRLRLQEREKRRKLKEAAGAGGGGGGEKKKKSKAEVAETLRKLTKAGKAKVLTNDGMDKALRSSQAFFSQLQDQVKSQIKGSREQSSKKKKQKEISGSKLKL